MQRLTSTRLRSLASSFALIAATVIVSGCSAPADDEVEGTTGEQQSALSTGWHNTFQCDGAHIDVDGSYSGRTQLVIDRSGPASYHKDKLKSALDNDPFTRPELNEFQKPSRSDEIVWAPFYAGDPRQGGFSASQNITRNGEIRLDVTKVAWDKEEQPGLYRKAVDLHVRIIRNGYREMQCFTDNGMGGGYDSYTYCNPTGGGWQEWEIANWIFRGCRSL
jgi:hypothetical protein